MAKNGKGPDVAADVAGAGGAVLQRGRHPNPSPNKNLAPANEQGNGNSRTPHLFEVELVTGDSVWCLIFKDGDESERIDGDDLYVVVVGIAGLAITWGNDLFDLPHLGYELDPFDGSQPELQLSQRGRWQWMEALASLGLRRKPGA